ncbi:MAG: gliding motility-associated C-terminal domain-containing protein, partial [Saprospiraceae bacterium]
APTVTDAQNQTVECDGAGNQTALDAWLNNNGGATATDDCGEVTWTNNFTALTGDCPRSATVIFTATDECGNESTTTATFSIEDTTAPTVSDAIDQTVECDGAGNQSALDTWLNTNGGATATDDCGEITWTNNFTALTGDCPRSATVIFTATDECGNESTTTATFSIEDTTAPTVSDAIDQTVECDGNGNTSELQAWLNNNGGATATDICGNVTWANNFTALTGDCPPTASVTFTATDACGNTSQTTATFTIEDTTAPSIIDAQDLTIECSAVGNQQALQAWLSNNGGATASDICGSVIWSNDYTPTNLDNCGTPITVTFTASDKCGNSTTTSASFAVTDKTVPTIAGAQDLQLNCSDAGNQQRLQSWLTGNGGAIATDDCGIINWTNDFDGNLQAGCTEPIVIVFVATDACGNSAQTTASITILDNQAPILRGIPFDQTVSCESIPEIAIPIALDDCDSAPTIEFEEQKIEEINPDNYILLRIWSAKDICNNVTVDTQKITVNDLIAPVFQNIPGFLNVDASKGETVPPVPSNITATDNCDPNPSIEFTESEVIDNCSRVITRTWVATDVSGNQTTATQQLIVLEGLSIAISPDEVNLCKSNSGQAEVIVETGTAPFTYLWTISGGVLENETPSNPTFIIEESGIYKLEVSVEDARGCVAKSEADVIVVDPLAAAIEGDSIYCEGETIRLFAYGGDKWEWTGPNGFTSTEQNVEIPDARLNMDGLYTVKIGNAGGCEVIFFRDVTIFRSLSTTVSSNSPICQQGTLRLFTSGQSDYEYQWTGPNGFTSEEQNPVLPNIDFDPGNYTFEVAIISPNGCSGRGVTEVTITEGAIIEISDDLTLCTGATITINATGGTDYFWQGPANFVSLSESVVIDNASLDNAGAYKVDIVTSNGCYYQDSIYVGILTTEAIKIHSNQPVCEGKTLALSVDFPNSEVVWEGPGGFTAIGHQIELEAANFEMNGVYTAKIVDSEGNCSSNGRIEVEIVENIEEVVVEITPVDCDLLGAIQLATNAEYTFDWADMEGTENPMNRADLVAGIYEVTITNSAGCTSVLENLEVLTTCDRCVNPPVILERNVTAATCGAANGSIDIITEESPLNYTFSWNLDGGIALNQFDSKRINLPSGLYIITITENENSLCQVIDTINLAPEVGASVTVGTITPATCLSATGSVNIEGPDTYTYQWNDGGTGRVRTDLPARTYEITVTDETGCSQLLTAEVSSEVSFETEVIINTEPACGEENGSVTIEVRGGSGEYTFSWGIGNQRDNLAPGIYEVEVTDNVLQCTDFVDFVLQNTEKQNTLTIGQASDLVLDCAQNLSIEVQTWLNSAGNAPIDTAFGTVVWTNDFAGTIPKACGNPLVVQFAAMDECGNTAQTSASLIIEDKVPPVLTDAQNLSIGCQGNNDNVLAQWLTNNGGAIATDLCGTISWTNDFTGMTGGNCEEPIIVRFTATDECGNAAQTSASINIEDNKAPDFVMIPADETISCGVIPDTIRPQIVDNCAFEPTLTLVEQLIEGDCVGQYTITRTWTATDACNNSTQATQTILVEDTEKPIFENVPSDINIDLGAAIPSPPILVAMDNCDANPSISLQEEETTDDCARIITRTWTAVDACGNSTATSQQIIQVQELVVAIEPTELRLCEGTVGNVVAMIETGVAPYQYQWEIAGGSIQTPTAANTSFTVEESGLYEMTLRVTDANGCSGIARATVIVFDPLSVSIEGDTLYCEGEPIVLAVEGGTNHSWEGPNGFSYTGPRMEIPNSSLNMNGEYRVRVENEGGCEAILSKNIKVVRSLSVSIANESTVCENGSLSLLASGQASYDYQWEGPNGFTATEQAPIISAVDLSPGKYTYQVTVTPPNSCGGVGLTEIEVVEGTEIEVSEDMVICEGESIALNATGGVDYFWKGPNNFVDLAANPILENATTAEAGVYVVEIQGNGNCQYIDSVFITVLTPESIEINTNQPVCSGGELRLSVPYPNARYQWSGPNNFRATTQEIAIDNVSALNDGIYQVTVSGGEGNCSSSNEITIEIEENIAEITPIITPIDCDNGGSIRFENAANYTFTWADLAETDHPRNRTDLAEGIYEVSITNAAGCTEVLENLSISDNCTSCQNPPVIADIKIKAATCGAADGGLDILMTENAVNYTFEWSREEGISLSQFNNKRINLPSGNYALTITEKAAPLCLIVEDIIIPNSEANARVQIDSIQAVSCYGEQDGEVFFTVSTSEDFDLPYTASIVGAGDKSLENGELPSGSHCLLIYDNNGCLAANACFEVTKPSELRILDLALQNQSCTALGTATIKVEGGIVPYTIEWMNLADRGLMNREELSAGQYEVFVKDEQGCQQSRTFEISKESCDTTINPVDTIVNPIDTLNACNPPNQAVDVDCDGDGLTNNEELTGIDDSTTVKIPTGITNPSDPTNMLPVDTTLNPVDTIVNPIDTISCEELWEITSDTLALDNCEEKINYCLNIPLVGVDNYTLLDNGGPLETTTCISEATSYFYSYGTMLNLEKERVFEIKDWTVNGQTYSASITGIQELVDSLSIWDTTADWEVDTVGKLIVGGLFSSNYSQLTIQDGISFVSAIFGINSFSTDLSIASLLGEGKYLITARHQTTGCADTLEVLVDCLLDSIPEIIDTIPNTALVDTLFITLGTATDSLLCLDTLFAMNYMIEDCSDHTPNFSELILQGNQCLQLKGNTVGVDTFCLYACDSLMNCRTIYLEVKIENRPLPNLQDDLVEVLKDEPKTIFLIENDNINGQLEEFGIIIAPENGTLVLPPDAQSVIYSPLLDNCGERDTFLYFVTNEFGSDTAMVQIEILCEALTVYSGFSPNGDGINDYFKIKGIENFPINEVSIFSRWGNMVYNQQGYSNEEPWDGTMEDKLLPDGTYFYVLSIEGREPMSGYVQIHR